MQSLSALIVADEKTAGQYRSLLSNSEHIEQCVLEGALDCLSRVKADVVMLDCGHRVWTGLSTMRLIKENRPDLPVLFLTDMHSEDAEINAIKTGASAYFEKPVNSIELKQAVERILSNTQVAEGGLVPGIGEEGNRSAHSNALDKPKNILEVIAFIEANLWSPLELEGLAEKAHLSKFHFCRIFKRHVGMNPMKYVTALRIERAKKLLTKDDLTISVVANKVGFRDMSNFIRQFKKVTGMAPRTYRNTARTAASP